MFVQLETGPLKQLNMDSIKQSCRLCLEPSPEKNDSISNLALRSKLDVVFRFELPHEDSLPAIVCHECSTTIDKFYSYHEIVRANQTQLRDFLLSDANMLVLVEVKGEPADDEDNEVQVDNDAGNQSQDDADVKNENDSAQSDLDELDTTENQDDLDGKKKRSMEDNLKIEQFFEGKIPCSICSAVSQTFAQLKTHGKEKHRKNAGVTCCKRKYFKKCLLVEHINRHLDPHRFYCELCKKHYKSQFYLQEHLAKSHANPQEHRYHCSKCDQTFPKETQLKSHLKRHIQVKCTLCDRMMANTQTLRVHMQIKHSEESQQTVPIHICDTCGRSYHQKQALEKHINLQHLGVKDPDRIQCSMCDKWFNSKYYLRHHTRNVHSGENTQVTCTICHQVYPNQRALSSHKNRVHTMPKAECDICGKTLKHAKHLKEHRAAHMGQRLYSCTVCDHTSNYASNLYAHMKSKHPDQWAQAKARGGSLLAEQNEPMEAEMN